MAQKGPKKQYHEEERALLWYLASTETRWAMVEVSILTLIMTPVPTPSIIVLQPEDEALEKHTRRVLPIWIGSNEAAQMGMALEKNKFERPMTHDLFLDALTNLDAQIDYACINKVKGTTFFAQLVLKQHGRIISLDARPSDALSLAIRQDCPLYVEDEVLNKASFPYIFRNKVSDEEELAQFHAFLKDISPEDFSWEE